MSPGGASALSAAERAAQRRDSGEIPCRGELLRASCVRSANCQAPPDTRRPTRSSPPPSALRADVDDGLELPGGMTVPPTTTAAWAANIGALERNCGPQKPERCQSTSLQRFLSPLPLHLRESGEVPP